VYHPSIIIQSEYIKVKNANWQNTSQLAIFVKHGRPVLLSNVNQGQVVIKGEIDLGKDLKSGLYIAVYYDIIWKSGEA